jgi:putative colanic acid biosynthesis acetyltransferase WcaF
MPELPTMDSAVLPRPSITPIDLTRFRSEHSFLNKLGRCVWSIAHLTLFRTSPRIFHGWRRALLRLFGASIGRGVRVYPSARIWAPWNLQMQDHSCLGPDVDCYCVAPIRIGAHAVVSQYSYLCAASHDYTLANLPLISAPITIGDGAWVTADVFVGMGVTVGAGAVVGARAAVFEDVPAWTVVGGNPARFIKRRELRG